MDVPVKLEIFEGPLDLLLHLIRKNEVDIYDIPVAMITSQYLEYLDMMQKLNISLAGEFLVMASTLTHLKSRMLLPSYDSSENQEEGEDPRLDLVAQLKEHMRFKGAAQKLEERLWLNRDVFTRGGGRQEVEQARNQEEEQAPVAASLFDLLEAFRGLLQSRGQILDLALPPAGISLEERMGQVLDLLRRQNSVTFEECFAGDRTRMDLVTTFLALLELTRVGLVRLYQERMASPDGSPPRWGPLRIFFIDPADEEEAET